MAPRNFTIENRTQNEVVWTNPADDMVVIKRGTDGWVARAFPDDAPDTFLGRHKTKDAATSMAKRWMRSRGSSGVGSVDTASKRDTSRGDDTIAGTPESAPGLPGDQPSSGSATGGLFSTLGKAGKRAGSALDAFDPDPPGGSLEMDDRPGGMRRFGPEGGDGANGLPDPSEVDRLGTGTDGTSAFEKFGDNAKDELSAFDEFGVGNNDDSGFSVLSGTSGDEQKDLFGGKSL